MDGLIALDNRSLQKPEAPSQAYCELLFLSLSLRGQQPSINLPERLQDDRILEFAKSRVASPGERYGPAMSLLGCQGVGHANRLLCTLCLFWIACYNFAAILGPLESQPVGTCPKLSTFCYQSKTRAGYDVGAGGGGGIQRTWPT